MSRSFIRSIVSRAGVLGLVASLTGCAANYTTDNSSTVLLIVASANGGAPLVSDVLKGGAVISDSAVLAIAVRFKNPNIATVPQIPSAVIIERYEIKYRRSDGRGVEGQDVPFSISGNITQAYDVKASGTDPLTIEVVRAQAKLEPPLRNLQSVTGTSLGGALVLTMFADITLHGRTISGQAVTGTGSLQIDFADYAEAAPTASPST
jgi:hypothetical protein